MQTIGRRCIWIVALAGVWAGPRGLPAATVVLANRTEDDVVFLVTPTGGKSRAFKLPSGEVQPVRTAGPVELEFGGAEPRRQYTLDPNAAYYFGVVGQDQVDLQKLGLGDEPPAGASAENSHASAADRPGATNAQPLPGAAALPEPTIVTIPVKILVDEEEMARREVWEARLRNRLDAVSDILQQHCFVRFEVVAVDTWQTDNATTDFTRSLTEFEHKVDPAPARLAIGFTSQYQLIKGRTHLGGTRGPLHSHLLIREWSRQISESERLEVLLHELGHFLGAVHSPEPDSVMRPILGDRKSRRKSFRIGFDPVNTLAMCLLSEELARRPRASLAEVSEPAQLALRRIYAAMIPVLPDDPAAAQYIMQVDRLRMAPLGLGAREVLQGVVHAAEVNDRRSLRVAPSDAARLDGDALAAWYVRGAARIAARQPPEVAAKSFLVGLALALDRSDQLRSQPLVGTIARTIEADDAREHRLAVLGTPTARGRADLLAHFLVSGALAAVLGPAPAESIGLVKEMRDAVGASGFSFVDYQANLAGVNLAAALERGDVTLPGLARGFDFDDYLPEPGKLPEGLSLREFERRFGALGDPRFDQVTEAVRRRIAALPAYRADADAPTAPKTSTGE